MTLGEVRLEGANRLRNLGVDTPELDATLLLMEVLKKDKTFLMAHSFDPIDESSVKRYNNFLQRREGGECVAYIVGRKEFRGLDFTVTPSVLVPRPDTEILVETALQYLDSWSLMDQTGLQKTGAVHQAHADAPPEGVPRVLDVCTGSGCVIVALKNERPQISAHACDISEDALAVARLNAQQLLPTQQKIQFYQSDLLYSVPGTFDLIVSNPPYVPSQRIPTLAKEVRTEPILALDGGADGLDLIRRLIVEAADRLSPGGALFLESDSSQVDTIKVLLEKAGFLDILSCKDLSGQERITGGRTAPRYKRAL